MVQTVHSFHRSVRLPVDNVAAAQPHREKLDGKIQEAATSLATGVAGLKWTTTPEGPGGHVTRLASPGFEIVITSRCGQDNAFREGVKLSFVSYTVSAASNMKALDRAATVAEELVVILRIAGAILFAVLFFLGVGAMFDAYGHVVIPHLFVALSVIGGGWAGERLGNLLGNWIQDRSLAKAGEQGALPELTAAWYSLEHKLKQMFEGYETL